MKGKKNKKITIDELAGMTQRGFLEIGEKMEKGFNSFAEQMKKGFAEVNKNISILSENNAREHEGIDLRLGNMAYRFELKDLENRVEVLEKKTGVKAK